MRFDLLETVILPFFKALPPDACNMHEWYIMGMHEHGKVVTMAAMQSNNFQCGTVGCIGGWTELLVNGMTESQANLLHKPFIEAHQYLEMTDEERDTLFMDFPDDEPSFGWHQWILDRLEGVIRDQKLLPYYQQMAHPGDDTGNDDEEDEEDE